LGSYQFVESLERFLLDAEKLKAGPLKPPAAEERAAPGALRDV
jgi:hypothetical protein